MSFEPDNITTNTYIAAFAGAILGLKAIPGATLRERIANVVFGFLLAVFVGPAAVEYLHIESVKLASGLTFAIGSSGLVIFSALLDGIKQTQIAAIISSWLSRKGTP